MLFARAPGQAFKVGLYLKRGCLLAVSVAAVLNRSEPEKEERRGGMEGGKNGRRKEDDFEEKGGRRAEDNDRCSNTFDFKREPRVREMERESVDAIAFNRPLHKERFLSRLPGALRTSADWNNKYLCHGTLQTRRTLSFVTTSRN